MCAERKPVISAHSFRKFVFSVFQGAFTFRGSMIDMPLLKQAQNIVTLATSIKEKWSAKRSSHQVGRTYTVVCLKDKPLYSRQLLSMLDWSLSLFTVHVNHKFCVVFFFFGYLTGASYSSKNELSSFWFQVCDFTVHGCVPSLDFWFRREIK